MKKFILFFVGLIVLVPGYAQSVEDYVTIAVKNNPELRGRMAEFEASMQRIPQVSGLPDPSLRASAFGEMVETRVGQQMARFSLEQMFPWFGTLGAQKNAAALSAQANYEAYRDARNQLAFSVRSAYYPLYELEQLLRIERENLEILNTFKTLATTKFQSGNGKLADALRADIMMSESRTEIAILESRRKPLVTTFNRLLNRAPEEEVVISENQIPDADVSYLLDSVLAQNPRLSELNLRIASAEAQQEAASKQGMPQLGLGLEYIIVDKRPGPDFEGNGKDAYMAMFSISLPIYRKKYRAAVSEAKYMQQAYAERKTEVFNQLATAFETALFERSKAKAEVALFNDQTIKTQQVIDLLLTGYGNSGTDFEEILIMEQALLKYKQKAAVAAKAYRIAEAQLMYLVSTELN